MTESVSSKASESPSFVSKPPSPRAEMTARAIVFATMYSVIAIFCMRTSPGSDPDIWWHMSIGRWILHHHAFPHVDVFSRLSPSPGWDAYSWLFDIITYLIYRAFGLVGTMGFVVVMVLAVLGSLHRMIARLQTDLLKAVLLTVGAIICLDQLYTPRSWLFSILFFVVQLDLLHRVRSTGHWKKLLWLLPMYAFWANVHIQFLDGLVVLAATCCEPLLMRFWPWPEPPRLSASKLFAILGGCIAVTLINPYGWGIYVSAYKLVSEPGVINQIQELLAMPFRHWPNYVVLGFAVFAAAMLGRQKRPDLWRCMLLAGGLIISFRSQRDVWFMVSIAAMILAECLPAKTVALRPLPKLARMAIAAAVIAIAFLTASILHINNSNLRKRMSLTLPVKAVDTVLAKGYTGPLLNDYTWGGYFIWRLPMPVSIDGRAALYGEKEINRSNETWSGAPNWASNPNLKSAHLVISPDSLALTQLLRLDPDFKLVYKDKLASIFVRNSPKGLPSNK